MNSVVLIGRLTKDLELRFIPSSTLAVTKMSLAVDKDMSKDKKQEAQAQGKPTADFINITIFGKQAENAANYLTKGSQCAIHGRINTNNYKDQEGIMHYNTDVIADKVEFLSAKEQGKPVQQNNDFPGEIDDVFTPVDDDSIPF